MFIVNNSKLFETQFDEYKLLSLNTSTTNIDIDNIFNQIKQESQSLYQHIVKGHVESQIVSRYYTAWDILVQIANNIKHKKQQKAKNIVDLISLLRAKPSDGPKKIWYVFFI